MTTTFKNIVMKPRATLCDAFVPTISAFSLSNNIFNIIFCLYVAECQYSENLPMLAYCNERSRQRPGGLDRDLIIVNNRKVLA